MLNNKEWWHTDSKGRRIGYLWPEDMLLAIDSIWGRRKGIGGFAAYIGVNRATIERYCNGKNPIPKQMAVLVASLQRLVPRGRTSASSAYNTRDFPRIDADWLEHPRLPNEFEKLTRN